MADPGHVYDPGDGSGLAVRIVNRDGSAISAGGGGGTSMTDDGAFTPGVSSVTPIGALADETTPDSVDEGDVGAVRMTLARGLHVNIRDDAGDSVMDGPNNAVRVNIVAGSGSGTEYTEDAAAAANPTGGALIMVRDDARGGSLTTTDGDNVGARGTNAGELYVKHVDAIPVTDNGGSLTVDGTVAVTNAGLTELAAAINASSQMDVNIAASGVTVPVSLASVPSHAVTNAGTFAVQESGAALTALQLIDNPVLVDDAAFTPGTSSVMMAGFQADELATDSVNEGDAGAARMTLDRKMIVTPQPHTAGGLSIFRSLDIDETEEEVKASAGVLYSIAAFNRTATPLYLKFYNATAANVTVGTTTPVLTFVVPANADSDGAGFVLEKTYGWTFDTAISVACTTGVADADTGAPGANDCVINLGYL